MQPRALHLRLRLAFLPTQVEDEEGRTHLLIHLTIEEKDADRWCLWRPDHAGFDLSVRSHNEHGFRPAVAGSVGCFSRHERRAYLNGYVRSEQRGKTATGHGPEGCDENGPAAVRQL